MGLKYHTIIVVPHERAKFRKWRISNRQLTLFTTLTVLLSLAAAYISWSYFATSVNLEKLASLRAENEQLREVNDSFESSIRTLQLQLADYEDRTNELAIVAGLSEVPAREGRAPASGSGAGGSDLDDVPGTHYDLSLMGERADELDQLLDEVSVGLDERLRFISSTPAIMPAVGVFTSGFGYRRDPINGHRAFHNGVDISARPGRPVRATADGIVTRAGRAGSLGRAVYVAHGFGLSTRYGHLSKISVKPGDRVRRGDTIGQVGNSGRTTGYHLHYEVRDHNRPKNPLAYILDRRTRG